MKTFKSFVTEAPIGKVKKGQMHKDLGKSPDAKITSSDIAKEKAKGGVFAKRAVFAQNTKKWHHEATDMTADLEKVLASEEQIEPLDELSKKTLGSYVKKASRDAVVSTVMAGSVTDHKLANKMHKTTLKRVAGVDKATDKLTKEETIVEEHEMSDAAHELVQHADNSAQLHHGSHMPIISNLKKKMKKGVYDSEKAKKLWGYHADRAAQSYHKEYGEKSTPWHKMFTTHDRKQAASHWEAHHRDELNEEVLDEAKPKVAASWYASGGHRTDPALVAKFAAQRKEKKQFASAKREIDSLKKQGK
jgi:nuclear transport factor 2 (NTF2) superfamily protein